MRRALAAVEVLLLCQAAKTFNLPTNPAPSSRSPASSSSRSSSRSSGTRPNSGGTSAGRACNPARFRSTDGWHQQQHHQHQHLKCSSEHQQQDGQPDCPASGNDNNNIDLDEIFGGSGTGGGVTRRAFFNTLGSAGAAAAAWAAVAGSTTAATGAPVADRNSAYAEGSRAGVFGEVVKSPNDPRSYRAISLASGMKVLLISDPETKTSAAAMDVHVGHFSDPDDLPGLAHFCEHLLFLGTDKYPDETRQVQVYSTYLSSHGGYSNAYTDTEDTVYFFDVGSDYLKGALDRFAQFFISPQFTETATGRELNAIEAENAKNQISDAFRGYQLEKLRANPMHPYSKFGTGNKKTLLDGPSAEGKSARQALLRFFDMYYSANQMTLVVLGKESLSQLQGAVSGMFAPVPNRGSGRRPSEKWIGKVKPFFNTQPLQAYNIVPVQELRSVAIAWPLSYENPEEKKYVLAAKPFTYIGSLLGHEGPGSLLSYLKEKNWANALGASASTSTDDFTIFEVEVDLTPEGFSNRFKVLTALFSYLNLIRKKGIPSYLPSELRDLSDLGWRFQDKREPGSVVPALAASMQEYAPENAISGPARLQTYNETLVYRLLDVMRPTPVDYSASTPLVFSTAKEFQGKADKSEKWYGTPYQVESLASQAKEWCSPPVIPSLKLPGPNPFVPRDLSVIKPKGRVVKPGEKVQAPSPVVVIPTTAGWKVRHKLDDIFAQPKAVCNFELVSPVAYESPRTVAALKLFEYSLDEKLNEYAYDAKVAGLGYSLDFTTRGVRLSFAGFGDKMPNFIEKVAQAVATFIPTDAVEFERLRDVVRRDLASYDTQQPYQHAMSNSAVASEDPRYTVKEIRDTLGSIKLADLKPLVSRVFERAEGLGLLQGNLEFRDVNRYMRGITRSFDLSPLPENERPEKRLVKFPRTPEGVGGLIRRREQNDDNDNSASQLQFQVSDRSIENRVLAQLLMSIMEDPYYDSLRTKQQLGYLVFSGVKLVEGVSMMYLLVQSAERDPTYLTDRSLEFLEGFRQELVDLPATKLGDYVGGLVDQKLEPDRRLSAEAERNWAEISTGQLRFDRRKEEAEALRKIREKDLLLFFDRHFREGGEDRRLLTSEVFAKKHAKDMETPGRGATLVTDEKKWRAQQEKFPVRPRLTRVET
ncbi:unnamed protein product [Pylaiella littoralis]